MRLDGSILGALHCFETAGRLLSFTKTAQAFNLTQSAVSQQIRNLEDRLGYPLFVRQARGLRLTEKGAILLGTMSSAFGDIQRTLQALGMSDAPLRVSCLPSLALQWLMPRLTAFHRQQPNVSVRVQAEFQVLDREAMETGDIDVAVRYDPVQYGRLHAEVMLDEILFPVATPAYLARHPAFASGESPAGVVLLHDAAPWVGASEFVEWRTWLEAVRPAWLRHLDGPQFKFFQPGDHGRVEPSGGRDGARGARARRARERTARRCVRRACACAGALHAAVTQPGRSAYRRVFGLAQGRMRAFRRGPVERVAEDGAACMNDAAG